MEKLEQELKLYFRCEVEEASPSGDWWQKAASRAMNQTQEKPRPKTGFKAWVCNLAEIMRINPRKPVWGIVTYLLLLVVYAGLSAGLTDIVSNFPASGGSPPMTSQPPFTTGPAPTDTISPTTVPPGTTQPPITITNTTVTLTTPAESMSLLHPLIFTLFLGFFVTMTFLVLVWRRKATQMDFQ
ncbi:MAG: hypothetical protein TUN42_08330 [Dehalogenimonas sp.]